MSTNSSFQYDLAFSRNLGWITESDQQIVASKRVAIAGMGGVGGHYVEVLARLGVTKFNIADFDEFEIQNFNRQNGSGITSLHKKKVEVMRAKILDINPSAEINVFSLGLNKENIDTFLSGVDIYLDGLDFFVFDVRKLVFEVTRKKKIPAITVAPVGMGASLIVFNEESKSFNDHFGFNETDSVEDLAIKFLIGLTPTLKQLKYLSDRTRGNFKEKKTPSLPMGAYLCAGVAGSEVVKILLGKDQPKASPWVLHFDAYLQTYTKSYLWLGHKNPIQKLKFLTIKKMLNKMNAKKLSNTL
jgi:molybdopterin/thiamine biosynthesis adenylyltransferase